jgi:hypothetical protein
MKTWGIFLVCVLLSLPLFACGHGAEAVVSAILFLGGTVFCVLGFITLTILTIINKSKPGKTRTTVYTVLLCFLTLIFLYLLYQGISGSLTDAGRMVMILFALFFISLITLNAVLLIRAFLKLKNAGR